MRICFLTDIKEFGGGEAWVIRACRQLRRMSHFVAVAAPLRSPLHEAAQVEKIDLFCYDRDAGSPFYNPLYHFLLRHKIEVIYCTLIGGFWEAKVLESVACRINANRKHKRLLVILKTGLPPLPGTNPSFYGVGLDTAIRRLHVVCDANRQEFLNWEFEMPESYVEVHREGIDLERFDPDHYNADDARTRWEVPAKHRVVTCLARLNAVKGQDNLLLAAAEILKQRKDVYFIFAGEGEDRERLESLAHYLGLEHKVRFWGKVGNVPDLLAATDIVCHPSSHDGLPNALVEASAMGVPAVASGICGIPEIITHEVNGLLIPPHDVRAIQQSLTRFLDNEPLRRLMGQQGYRRARQGFDIGVNLERLAHRLEAELRDLAAGPKQILNVHTPGVIPVLFLLTYLRTGGEETEVCLLASSLDRSHFRPSVMTCYDVNEPSPVKNQLIKQGVPVDTGMYALDAPEEKIAYIVDYIHREGIRVLVACQDTALAYHVMMRLHPGECAMIEHGGIVDETARIPKDRTSRYIGVSEAITRAAAEQMPLEKRHHAVCLPSMVDPSLFPLQERHALREAYGFASDEIIVLFVGRIEPRKGIEHIIDAARNLAPHDQPVRFLLVGPPDAFQPGYTTEMLGKSRDLIEGGRFMMVGGRDDVPQLMTASDLLLLPAVGEGMSHVINEAGAAGLAVVAFDDGAANEQLQHGEAGVLVDPSEPEGLRHAVDDLIANPERRALLAHCLREKVMSEYCTQQLIPQWEQLIEAVCTENTWLFPPIVNIIKPDEIPPFPREIQIQTNTYCNASCIMCPHPTVSRELSNGQMPMPRYESILNQCSKEATLSRIEPFLMNEPFTDKRMVDLIQLARKTVPHAMTTLTSNGCLLRPELSDRLIKSGLNAIWFSFNGATKKTYEAIMGIRYDDVVANIDYLLSIRPKNLQVFTNMIETTALQPEIEANIRRWQERGVGSGSSILVNRGGNVENYDELNYRPVSDRPIRICDLLYHKMYVLYNGDVVLCCMDWRRQVVMGNVDKQSLRDIWQAEKYQHYRQMHEEGRSGELDLCNSCSFIYQ